ncbi:MAG: YncE family protein [Chlamydiales bacterium]|nr:YncE family protein [Chlamydiales bacterium]
MKFCYLFFCLIIARLLSASPFVWVPDQLNHQVLVIDAVTKAIFKTISQNTGSFEKPFSIAMTPDGLFAYVFNGANHTVSVINTKTYQLKTLISLRPLSSATTKGQIAVSPNGAFVYVANAEHHVVSIINTSKNSLSMTLSGSGMIEPTKISFSPNSSFAYVTDSTANQVFRINTSSYAIVAPFSSRIFNKPDEIAISTNGAFAYVINTGFSPSKISVLNLVNDTVLTSIDLPVSSDPDAIVLSPDGTRAYVACADTGKIFIIDTMTHTLIDHDQKSGTIPNISINAEGVCFYPGLQ